MMRHLLAIAAAVTSFWLTSPVASARADDHAGPLAAAHAAMDDVDWGAVEGLLAPLLADPTAPIAQRIEGLMLLGYVQIADAPGDDGLALGRATFARVFDLDAAAQAPANWTSRVREAFETARVAWQLRADADLRRRYGATLDEIRLEVAAPDRARGGRPLRIAALVRDPTGAVAHTVRLARRRSADELFTIQQQVIADPAGGELVFQLTADETASDHAYQLQYYVELRAEAGGLLRTLGTAAEPRHLAVEAGHPRRLWQRWQFWVAIGATALAGGAVAAWVALDAGPQSVEVTP